MAPARAQCQRDRHDEQKDTQIGNSIALLLSSGSPGYGQASPMLLSSHRRGTHWVAGQSLPVRGWGTADFAIGVAACVAFGRDVALKVVAICAASIFPLGDAIGHVREMIVGGNFACCDR